MARKSATAAASSRTAVSSQTVTSSQPAGAESKGAGSAKTVTFEYFAPSAKKVYVAGNFNSWKLDGLPLKKDRSGRWSAELELPPGSYEYRFLVDGNWQNEQKPVEYRPNEFGSANCLLKVD